jgi:hypothetical protein
MEEALEMICAMRSQEDTGYVTPDWLQLEQSEPQKSVSANFPLHCQAVDVDCREQIATWYQQLVDKYKFSRETVEIAMSFLDRFLGTTDGTTARKDRNVYKLASMTALYTAIKIHEFAAMDNAMVAKLSRGAFSPLDVEAMEIKLLHALGWRVNPPTALAFVQKLLLLVPEHVLTKELRQVAFDLTVLQTELAVGNYLLVPVPASTVAYSALMNSLESLGLHDDVLGNSGYTLSEALQIDCNSDLVIYVQNVLYESVVQQPVYPSPRKTSCSSKLSSRQMSIEKSPRSIANEEYTCHLKHILK